MLHRVFAVERHVSSVVFGFHGYIDMVFEGKVLSPEQSPEAKAPLSKILFEIKTGKAEHKHRDQVG